VGGRIGSVVMVCMSRTREEISTQAAQKGRPARPQAEQESEAYPRGTLRILAS
jgi:hypothetical protein